MGGGMDGVGGPPDNWDMNNDWGMGNGGDFGAAG